MRVLCVIPVRGGSKGIPRKNLREIAGKPLVAWTILQALAARDELAGSTRCGLRSQPKTKNSPLSPATTEPRFRSCVPRILPKTLQPPNR